MARKTGRQAQKKKKVTRKRKRKVQKGGAAPFYVDFKKGVDRTKNLVKALKKGYDKDKAIKTVNGYKREYAAYKRRGGKKSYESWGMDKGYMKRDGASSCSIM
jgi:hypothetical protein